MNFVFAKSKPKVMYSIGFSVTEILLEVVSVWDAVIVDF